MKPRQKLPVCLLGAVLVGAAAFAATPDSGSNPYVEAITKGNVFKLNPFVPPPPPTNAPPPTVTLVGLARVFGVQKAIVKIAEPGKPLDPIKDVPLVMEVGQREKDVELVAIDEAAGTIKINNHGVPAVVAFDKNVKLPTGPAGGAPVPMPGMPGVPMPGFVPPAPRAAAMGIPAPGFAVPAGTAIAASAAGLTMDSSGARNIPTRTLRLQEKALSPEEQVVLMEVQRADFQAQGQNRMAALLPPTVLTPKESQASQPTTPTPTLPQGPGAGVHAPPPMPPIPGR